jgi:hypothetical protein
MLVSKGIDIESVEANSELINFFEVFIAVDYDLDIA